MNEEYVNLIDVLKILIADLSPTIGFYEAQRLVNILDDIQKGGAEA